MKSIHLLPAFVAILLITSCKNNPESTTVEELANIRNQCDSLSKQNAELEARVACLDSLCHSQASEIKDLGDDLEDVIRFLGNEFSY